MMSLWDALRMNMMISYQELVRTFLNSLQPTIFYDHNTTGCGHKIIWRSRCYKLAFYIPQSKPQ